MNIFLQPPQHMFRTISKEDTTLKNYYDASTARDKQEIGVMAVWSLSSAKPGFGVEQLRDDNIDTYWQYDPSFYIVLIGCTSSST